MRDWITDLPWVVRQSWRDPHRGYDFYPSARMTTDPRVIVDHSTETTGFVSYNNGAAAPHFTGDLRSGEVRQHVPLSWGSRCLAISADNGRVRDATVNITGVIQIEWIGAVTPGYPARFGHYDLPGAFGGDERAQFFVARLWRAIHEAVDGKIPLQLSGYGVWNYSGYGAYAKQRLTSRGFRDARGILGHLHVVANDHWDGTKGRAVGGRALDMEKAAELARTLRIWVATPTPPVQTPPDFSQTPSPANNFFFPADETRAFQALVNDLIGAGFLPGPRLVEDGVLHGKTMTVIRELQKQLNVLIRAGLLPGITKVLDEDGLHGPRTTTATEALFTMLTAKLDQVLAGQKRIEAKLDDKPTAVQVAKAVWSHVLYGFTAHWHLRRGNVPTPDHAMFPADPGSPADRELRAAAAANGGRVRVYTPDGLVALRLDEATDTFTQEA